jgi:RHS repeat-associated protein
MPTTITSCADPCLGPSDGGHPNAPPDLLSFTRADYDTGSYYRARYYDPTRSRFVSEDPIGLEGGLNRFTYVAGNPERWVDPEGLQVAPALPWNPGAGALGGGGASAGALRPLQPLTPGQWEQMKEDLGRWLDPWPLVNYVAEGIAGPVAPPDPIELAKSAKRSQKERATDAPSWMDHNPRRPNETCGSMPRGYSRNNTDVMIRAPHVAAPGQNTAKS